MRSFKLLLILICLTVLLVACTNEKNSNLVSELTGEMSKSGIKFGEIYHIEVTDNGLVVFYEDLIGGYLSSSILQYTQNGWKLITGNGGVTLNPENGISYIVVNGSEEFPLYHSFGIVNNADVNTLTTFMNNKQKQKQAKIIQTEAGLRIWVAFYEEAVNPPFLFIGTDKNGEEVVYQGIR